MKQKKIDINITIFLVILLMSMGQATTNFDVTQWRIYDNSPKGAKINILNEKSVLLEGYKTKNAFIIGGRNQDTQKWDNQTDKILKWKMKFSSKYYIYVSVTTKNNSKFLYLIYSSTQKNGFNKNKTTISNSLGKLSAKNQWVTIERDLNADLRKYDKKNSILAVNGIIIRGTGTIKDLNLINNSLSFINVKDYVVGDGIYDDSIAFQEVLNIASDEQKTLFIPKNTTIRTTNNIFIHGKFDIQGADETSIILADADMERNRGYSYWISVGISNHKDSQGKQHSFDGSISNLCFKTTKNAKFKRGVFLFNTSKFNLDKVFFDYRETTNIKNQILFGATSSGNNYYWEPSGQKVLKNISISNCKIIANHLHTDSEGFGINNATNVQIINNYIYGIGDDPIGAHNIQKLLIKNNRCYSIDGRIYVSNSSDVQITQNYCERIKENNTTWYGGGALIYIGLEGNNNKPAPRNILIDHNKVVLPKGIPSYTYGIRALGTRTLTIDSNTIIMNSSERGGNIRIEADIAYPQWIDKSGLDNDHIARPRDVIIKNNSCIGNYPGGIQQTGKPFNLRGPFSIYSNRAGSYLWYSNFTESNNIIIE